MSQPSLVWFRNDLRLDDQAALAAAAARGEPVIPVFIWSPDEEGHWKPGAASRWWLHQSLKSLGEQLEAKGSRLILRAGDSLQELERLIKQTNAGAVYWTRRYEPTNIKCDKHVETTLRKKEIAVETFNGQLLFEPWELETKTGNPYQVFTAFWKACLAKDAPPMPTRAPKTLMAPSRWPDSEKLKSFKLEPTISWDEGIRSIWTPGGDAAHRELKRFLKSTGGDYDHTRDLPSIQGTSRLSPHLHFGEISPRTIWHEVHGAMHGQRSAGFETYIKELIWREFSHHLLYHFPKTTDEPLREQFAKFPWAYSREHLKAWQRGLTGFPIVDAGMRELWTTGWMHNRVRLIVASFLVKDLLIAWQRGAEWFWDTLVDADLGNNTMNWQWTAGCGADAAPYFRIFNPSLQSAKFDPDGHYIRKWVPELKKLPTKLLHRPWTATEEELERAGVKMGQNYPHQIVDHDEARTKALAALKKIAK